MSALVWVHDQRGIGVVPNRSRFKSEGEWWVRSWPRSRRNTDRCYEKLLLNWEEGEVVHDTRAAWWRGGVRAAAASVVFMGVKVKGVGVGV